MWPTCLFLFYLVTYYVTLLEGLIEKRFYIIWLCVCVCMCVWCKKSKNEKRLDLSSSLNYITLLSHSLQYCNQKFIEFSAFIIYDALTCPHSCICFIIHQLQISSQTVLLSLFNHLAECAIELLARITANGRSRCRNYLQRATLYRRASGNGENGSSPHRWRLTA